ncbi:uncharacterized protein EV422DRAFT_508199 [Fimicolochytrium jonesii]|uniref:uncharacterized protein n=1 Tax=Fimicolochytrium jonesii TaxID=1396493 RepID=UPI0022FEB125|nr:uncharacterized protein EV422DRAFT_508199 [Fimicolochytrium jonesii]KAI8818329.1 hypothetical protein EV422DRAFT_508199 [Fimicolochytrium jonesii]
MTGSDTPRLPLELIPLILNRADKTAQARMALVSRTWHDLLIKNLYARMHISNGGQLDILLTTLIIRPERFAWVKEVDFDIINWNPRALGQIHTILTVCRPERVMFASTEPGDESHFGWDNGRLLLNVVRDDLEGGLSAVVDTLCWQYALKTTHVLGLGWQFFNRKPNFPCLRMAAGTSRELLPSSRSRWWQRPPVVYVRLKLYGPSVHVVLLYLSKCIRFLDVAFCGSQLTLPRWSNLMPKRLLRYVLLFWNEEWQTEWQEALSKYNGGGVLEIWAKTRDTSKAEIVADLARASKKFDEVSCRLLVSSFLDVKEHPLSELK